jgi:hypothetical protein
MGKWGKEGFKPVVGVSLQVFGRFLIPSSGRGVMDCVVAGRGLCAIIIGQAYCRNPSLHPPWGGNRTGPRFYLFRTLMLFSPCLSTAASSSLQNRGNFH